MALVDVVVGRCRRAGNAEEIPISLLPAGGVLADFAKRVEEPQTGCSRRSEPA